MLLLLFVADTGSLQFLIYLAKTRIFFTYKLLSLRAKSRNIRPKVAKKSVEFLVLEEKSDCIPAKWQQNFWDFQDLTMAEERVDFHLN